jgi:hypothetical protein
MSTVARFDAWFLQEYGTIRRARRRARQALHESCAIFPRR